MENVERSNIELVRITSKGLSDDAWGLIREWGQSKTEVKRPNWHQHFILQSFLASIRSLDAQTQCGCVIVKDNRILSSGYNSFIGGIDDSVLPNLRPHKYPFMIHSEHNAILNCAKNGVSCEGASAYVTGPPCCACLQYMYQAGIKCIYFADYNAAVMTQNKEYELQFEILSNLMTAKNLNIFKVLLDAETIEKIEKIKSCR